MSASRMCRSARSVDRKITRLNSSHVELSYAVFCLKKKKHAISPRSAHDTLRVRESLVELKRRVARNVAILVAWVLEHFRDRVERGETLGARGRGLLGGWRSQRKRKE